ncbi:hypothetical protein ACLOJK_013803 [Asimina triloba]
MKAPILSERSLICDFSDRAFKSSDWNRLHLDRSFNRGIEVNARTEAFCQNPLTVASALVRVDDSATEWTGHPIPVRVIPSQREREEARMPTHSMARSSPGSFPLLSSPRAGAPLSSLGFDLRNSDTTISSDSSDHRGAANVDINTTTSDPDLATSQQSQAMRLQSAGLFPLEAAEIFDMLFSNNARAILGLE